MGPIETITKAWELGGGVRPSTKGLDAGQPTGSAGAWWLSRAGYMRQLRDVGSGTASSIVVACLRVLAEGFSEAPPEVWETDPDGTPVVVPNHPLSTLLARPNPEMIGDLLWQYYVWATRIDGNAYLYKQRSASGKVVELWPLRPDLVEPKSYRDSGNLVDYFEYRPTGTAVSIDRQDVVHLRIGLDPSDHRRGLAPLKVVLKEILGDEEASRFGSALLSNLGIPGVILAPGAGELGPDEQQADRIRERWRERFGGDRRGDPLVLSGPMEVKTVAFSPQQLDLKTLRRLPEERVSAVLGVPAILAGLGTGLESSSGRSESVTLVEMFTERTLSPDWRRVGRWLSYELLPEFELGPARWVDFDTREVSSLQEDRNQVWARADSAVRSGWLTVAEAKRLVGLEPDAADDVYLRSMGVEAVPYGTFDEPEREESPNGRAALSS